MLQHNECGLQRVTSALGRCQKPSSYDPWKYPALADNELEIIPGADILAPGSYKLTGETSLGEAIVAEKLDERKSRLQTK